ncbi:hypothetical protein SLS62_009068 [Diatrype stigma]|uniref:Nephrocystin 3-like N-terminal domain-containing protein n=1 Tax=Diatrype stigma TaxID=117547 RepID=A0AAN9UPB6_9PEZI
MHFPWQEKRRNPRDSAQRVDSSKAPSTSTDPESFDSSPNPSFPDGVKVLHDCPDADVDICFVHGLTGDRESTWTARGQSKPWPQTLLPPKLPNARILTYGYDAYVIKAGVVGDNGLSDHAMNLLHDLSMDRSTCNASSRPLIFIAHSLGGLVCKRAILHSQANRDHHLRGIFDCTKGIIFMGTPHRGSWAADSLKMPLSVLALGKSTNKKLVQVLRGHNNQLLESLQQDFLKMTQELQRNGRALEIACFFEELPLPVIGKIVSKESATFEGHNPFTIHADHRGMVRFASEHENGFKRLLGELTRWHSQISKEDSHTIALSVEDCQSCLKSLAFPAIYDRSHDIGRAVAGTCDWLLRHEKYNTWAAYNSGLLWIKGKPGSGKSTLLKHALINQRTASSAIDNDLILSFFFHDRGDELQKTPLGFFRSLIHQVLRQAPDTLTDLVDTFDRRCREIGDPGEKWKWHQEELRGFLESSLPKVLAVRPVWLYVDALDECGEDNAVNLFDWFISLLQTSSSVNLLFRICVTCRHYPILVVDRNCDVFEICPEQENEQSISIYVGDQFSRSRKLAESPIASWITNSASGVFLWAFLVVQQALKLDKGGVPPKEIERRIFSNPKELNELYHKLVEDMSEKHASLRLIQWICFATQTLTLDELRWAMAVEPDCPYQSLRECQWSGDYIQGDARIERRVQTLSCGLVEVIKFPCGLEDVAETPEMSHIDGNPTWDVNSRQATDLYPRTIRVAQFIHQSVKDFFVDRGLSALDDSPNLTRTAVQTAHFQLSKTCVHYIMMDELGQLEDGNRNLYSPLFALLQYAISSLVTHIKQGDASAPQQDIMALLDWPSNAFMRSETASNIDLKDYLGQTPLSIAAENGSKDIAELLLATNQVDPNTKDNEGWTPLLWAAKNGYKDVIELLLATDQVDADTKDNKGRTLLSWAAANNYKDVVQLLLAKGQVDPNTKDNKGQTPLLRAAKNGHKGVIELLLATDQVDADTKDNKGRTPLLRAAKNGYKGVIELLLATDQVDADTKDNKGRTPLLRAVKNGHKDVIELLLATDQVDADTKDNKGQTPLSWAAENDDKDVVQLLLAKGQVDTMS